MSWSLYLLVAVILVGCVLALALFGGMVWLARRKDSGKPNV